MRRRPPIAIARDRASRPFRTARLLLAVCVALVAALPGCASAPPRSAPSIRGSISSLDRSSAGTSMLVEGPAATGTSVDKAMVRVDGKTRVFVKVGGGWRRGRAGDLAQGRQVEVWFSGPVAESYPVQAYAGTVAILK